MDGGGRVLAPLKSAFVRGFGQGLKGSARGRRTGLPRGIGSAAVIALFVAIGIAGGVTGGHYEDFKEKNGSIGDILAGLVGFRISAVTVIGNKELTPEEVIRAAGLRPGASLPFLEAGEVKERLVAVPLIREAAVRKLYPGRLAITIEERVPHALWQKDGAVFVVARDGTIIDRLNDRRFLRLPHVVGHEANKRADEFAAILAGVPEFADMVRAGTLISERRWTLKLKNGLEVKLPEIDPIPALQRFAALEKDARLTEKAIIGVDLRIPGRVIVRLTEEAAEAREETINAKLKPKGRG